MPKPCWKIFWPRSKSNGRPGGHRLYPNHLYRHHRIVGRERFADPRMRGIAAQIRQSDRNIDLHHRSHHQGRHDRRPENPGAHRRCRTSVRRGQQPDIPYSARNQEPFRSYVRNRRFRDARRRVARGGQSVGNPAFALRNPAQRHRRRSFGGRHPPLPDRSAGTGKQRGLRHSAAHGDRLRQQTYEHAGSPCSKNAWE